jgi:hypothetical protein
LTAIFIISRSTLRRPGRGRLASASNILSQHTRFLLGPVEAKKIVEDMKQLVSAAWYNVVRAEGVSERDAEAIRAAIVYPGSTDRRKTRHQPR